MKKLMALTSMLLLAGVGCSTSSAIVTSLPSTAESVATKTNTPYTMADVQAHASQSSCWATIDGKVYDLTQWISQHPGGEQAIIQLCGTDGTQAFHAQHATSRRPEAELAQLQIGTLAQ